MACIGDFPSHLRGDPINLVGCHRQVACLRFAHIEIGEHMGPTQLGIVEIRAQLQTGALTSVELTTALIERTHKKQGLHGYVTFDESALLRQAAEADKRISAGESMPLLGVPIALKDNIDSVDYPSSAGTSSLMGSVPMADSDVALKLRAAGALIAGKANMHELAFGITTDNHVTGEARNPWNPERILGAAVGAVVWLWRPGWCLLQLARIPAVRSACPHRCVAWLDSGLPWVAFPGEGLLRSR